MCKKSSIIILSIIATIVLAVCSCTFETSKNGDLDGAWHLLSINGKPLDEHPQLYWSIQSKLLELRDKSTNCGIFLLRFSHEGSTLKVYQPYIYDRENGDKVLEDATPLQPFGIYKLEETFEVKNLNGSRMTLKSENVTLEFRKF